MDTNLRLFSERLKRLLAGEEGILPDSTNLKPRILNILFEIITVISLLQNYEGDMAWLMFQLINEEHVDREDFLGVLKEINCFFHESGRAIDTFTTTNSQSSATTSKEFSNALIRIQNKIIDIRSRVKRLPPNREDVSELKQEIQTEASDSSSSSYFSCSEFIKKRDMEQLLDVLIEGQPQLSVIAILDSTGFDKTAFAGETYNNNHAKFYFDCRAWVRLSLVYNFNRILDEIMKSVMPASVFSAIMDQDYELKKTLCRDFLTNKKYLIVLDDVHSDKIWDDLRDILPDCQNGSRILLTVGNPNILTSFQLESGEKIRLDSVPTGGQLTRIKHEDWLFLILYHGSKSLEILMQEMFYRPSSLLLLSVLELPFNLKVCCLYMSVFYEHFVISTRQLYQLWTAQGFIPHNCEETAEKYFEELINRGFIQVEKRSAGGRIKTCSLNSTVWDVLATLAHMMEFIMIWDQSFKPFNLFPQNKSLTKFVSVEPSDMYYNSLLTTFVSTHLALLDCKMICKNFKFLRVLSLGHLVLDQYPSAVENLFYLKYLKLNIPSLKSLPSSLFTLLNLYTLDMPSSYIDHTPQEIWKMDKLMHLNFGCITFPAHPGKYCNSLKSLSYISALSSSSCTPDILARLPNVQTLRIYGDLSYYQSGSSKSLCKLLKLKCLKMVNESKMRQLSQIVLAEYQFPSSLTQLSFSNTELKKDPMPTLEKLPHLQVLKLKQKSYYGRELACLGVGSFPQLKILHLKSMFWLEEWIMGGGAMPKLESLVINPCAYLKKLPEELWRIKSLCKLELHWPHPELRKRLRAFEDMERRYEIQKFPYGI